MRTGGGGVVKRHVGFPTIDPSAFSPFILIGGHMQREAIRELPKHAEKMSKTNKKKLLRVATVSRARLQCSATSHDHRVTGILRRTLHAEPFLGEVPSRSV